MAILHLQIQKIDNIAVAVGKSGVESCAAKALLAAASLREDDRRACRCEREPFYRPLTTLKFADPRWYDSLVTLICDL